MGWPLFRKTGVKRRVIKHRKSNEELKTISDKFPKKFNDYFDPFLGKGEMFFYLKIIEDSPANSFLSDSSPEIILTYKDLRDDFLGFIEDLGHAKGKYMYDASLLLECHEVLQDACISQKDFRTICPEDSDLVFCKPPRLKGLRAKEIYIDLLKKAEDWTNLGAYVVIVADNDKYIKKLFLDWTQEEISKKEILISM